ncbi:MAG: hypothetical protein H6Q72_3688 [Firmicutes bacterium]|nr:hypothetical protein [Bacillota bacterium]
MAINELENAVVLDGPILFNDDGSILAVKEENRFVVRRGWQNEMISYEVENFLVKFHPGAMGAKFPVVFADETYFKPMLEFLKRAV